LADRELRLHMIFAATEKASGPMRAVAAGSKAMAAELKASSAELDKLQYTQSKIKGFRELRTASRETARELVSAEAKMAALAKAISESEKPTKKMAAEFARAERQTGKLKDKLTAQKASLQDLRSGLNEAGVSTVNLRNHERSLSTDIARVNTAIDQQKFKLGQLADREAKLDKIRERAQTMREKWSGRADATRDVGVKATAFASLPIGAILIESARAAMAAEELNSAFKITFKDAGENMDAWAEKTANAMGRSITEMKSGTNAFGLFFNQAAKTRPEAAAMSKQMAILAQDMSSFFNVSGQDAQSALFSGLSGESEPLRKFGVFLNDSAVKTRALKMGLGGVKGELTDQEKIMARYSLIMEATKNAQGDVARTAGSVTNQLRKSGSQWENLKLKIGEELLPKLTPVIEALSSLLEGFANLSPGMQKFLVYAALIGAAFGPALIGISALFSSIGTLGGGIIGITTRFGGLIDKFAVVKSVAGMAGNTLLELGSSAAGIGRAFLMTPFGMVVTAIAAIAGGSYLIYKNWDTLGPWFSGVWDKIAKGGEALIAKLDSIDWASVTNKITSLVSTAIEGLLTTIDGTNFSAMGDKVGAKIVNWFENVDWGRVGSIIASGFKLVGSLGLAALMLSLRIGWALIVAGFQLIKASVVGVFGGMWDGIVSYFTNGWARLTKKMEGWANTVKSLLGFGEVNPKINVPAAKAAALNPAAPRLAGARANGGPVSAGKSYLVGERGMEIFSPTLNGSIFSNEKLAQLSAMLPSLRQKIVATGAATVLAASPAYASPSPPRGGGLEGEKIEINFNNAKREDIPDIEAAVLRILEARDREREARRRSSFEDDY
jgi:hypothetical protein